MIKWLAPLGPFVLSMAILWLFVKTGFLAYRDEGDD